MRARVALSLPLQALMRSARSWLKRHYSEEGTDHVRPFLFPFKMLSANVGGLGNAPGAEVPQRELHVAEWKPRGR